MPRKATASIRFRRGKWEARVTLGPKSRPSFSLPTCRTEEEAVARGQVLADLAQKLKRAGQAGVAPQFLQRAAEEDGKGLERIVEAVGHLCSGRVILPTTDKREITFRKFAEQWTTGELHKQWPDHVKKKKSHVDDRGRLARHVYPLVGDVPLVRFTVDHAEVVMRSLPETMAPRTRRQIAQVMHRVLAIAVFPARIIATNPLPPGFLPTPKDRKALTYLYPDEDRALLECQEVPLGYRVLYGFLTREGMRRSEAGQLTWGDVDLGRGGLTLDENKTDDPRAWALDPGVRRALQAWWKRCGETGETAPVFVDSAQEPLNLSRIAETLRDHLQTAGVTRAALYARTTSRQPIRAHDLRATFITVSLANGRSESWVSDRTGHRSSMMINRYRRAARSLAELGLGTLAPLDEVIPELAVPFEKGPETEPRCEEAQATTDVYATTPRKNRGKDGGGGGIRTPGRVAPTTDFKSAAFDRSATPP